MCNVLKFTVIFVFAIHHVRLYVARNLYTVQMFGQSPVSFSQMVRRRFRFSLSRENAFFVAPYPGNTCCTNTISSLNQNTPKFDVKFSVYNIIVYNTEDHEDYTKIQKLNLTVDSISY